MGQRVLLFLFRAFAALLLVTGLAFSGIWALGKELVNPESDIWVRVILEFVFRLGVTCSAAGIVAPVLLRSIRPVSSAAGDILMGMECRLERIEEALGLDGSAA